MQNTNFEIKKIPIRFCIFPLRQHLIEDSLIFIPKICLSNFKFVANNK